MECFILIQVKIITDVIGPTWEVLCGYNLCTGDGVMEDARKLRGERNWRNGARNRDSWQKLLKKLLAQKGLLCH